MKQPLDFVQSSSNWKSLVIFIIIVYFIFPFAEALEIGISPAEVSLNSKIEEEKCFTLQIFGEKDILLSAYDSWDTQPVATRYQKQWKMTKNQEQHEICVLGKEAGIFRGMLWITDAKQKLAIGIRMYVEVMQSRSGQEKSITGSVINKVDKNLLQKNKEIGLIVSMNLLCFILLGLLIKMLNKESLT